VTETRPDEDVRFVIQRELSLLRPDAGTTTAQVEALLHPDFCEVAASGQRLDRREVIAALGRREPRAPHNGAGSPAGAPPSGASATVSGLTGTRLSTTVILVGYISDAGGQRARRSSLWLKTGPSWRRYFHQGTPITAG
jgi:hypothetical protein